MEQTFSESEIDILYQSFAELSEIIPSNLLSEKILSKVLSRACKENNLRVAEKIFAAKPDLMKDERLSLAFLAGSFRVFFFYLEKNDFLMVDLIRKTLMSTRPSTGKRMDEKINRFLSNFHQLSENILKSKFEKNPLRDWEIENIFLSEKMVSREFFTSLICSGFLSEEILTKILRVSCIFNRLKFVEIFYSYMPDFMKQDRLKLAFSHNSREVISFYLDKNDPWEYEYIHQKLYRKDFLEILDLAPKPAKKPFYIDSKYSSSNSSDLLCIACHDGNWSSYLLLIKAKIEPEEFHLALALAYKNFKIAMDILQLAFSRKRVLDLPLVEKIAGPIIFAEFPSKLLFF